MAVESVSGMLASKFNAAAEAVEPIARSSGFQQFTGTSDAPHGGSARSDRQSPLKDQLDDLVRNDARQNVGKAADSGHSGVASANTPPATSVKEVLNQVRSMYEFSIKATLLSSVATQGVSAVTTLAKSQ
jgi:hypothetical protein